MLWIWLACVKSTTPTAQTAMVGVEQSTPSVVTESEPTEIDVEKNVAEPDLDAFELEAVALVKQFGGTLKPQLKAAIQAGGTVKAIEVCSQQAPQIAQSISTESGWSVKRVSLKARNSTNGTPDDWERETLEWFDAQVEAGVDASAMVKAEVVDGTYRFMKAQPVQGLCLSCHGEALSPDTETALLQHYPDDLARGYQLGQVRGAFSVQKQIVGTSQ